MTQPLTDSKTTSCTACSKRINNVKWIKCSVCKQARHLKCAMNCSTEVDAICPKCIINIFPFSQIESEHDFYLAVSSRINETDIDHNLLNSLRLQLKCDFTSTFLTPEEDLDPDMNYYNMLLNNPVNYYDTAQLNPQVPTPALSIPQFCMHINARS